MALTKAKLIELIGNGDIDVGGGGVNPNLLHNWDFTNPINQRSVTGTFSGGAYGIDRWKHISGGYGIVYNGYLGVNGAIGQWIEGKRLVGKICTFSLKKLGGQIISVTAEVPNNSESITPVATGETLVIGSNATNAYVFIITSSELGYLAAKLELGTISTLHLDPPVDHAIELPKCQRFFQSLITPSIYQNISIGRGSTTRVGELYISLPQAFRITPSISTSGSFLLGGLTPAYNAQIVSLTVAGTLGAGLVLNATIPYDYLTIGYMVFFLSGSAGAAIFLSADL